MNSKRKIEINIVEVQTYKILIQINSSILIIIFALTSCDKNELNNFETIKVKNGYSVENGYIKFENINE